MHSSTLRSKVVKEVQLIPENKLEEIYDFIHYFRIGIEASEEKPMEIMKFAGCWNDMPNEIFTKLSEDIADRRRNAFSGRRDHETSFD